ncbi:hypothetical protein [Streptomyces aureocirculatus]|uniref:hypothetical protein n=1 Tax=Streptomyces aureocirculatus TaxID=67275 RepID=UPI0004C5D3DD|nr:hypothetical protein [Streptomyces aureocirculatus]
MPGRAAAGADRAYALIANSHTYVDDDPVRTQDVLQPYIGELARFLEVEKANLEVAARLPGSAVETVNAFWNTDATAVMTFNQRATQYAT